MKNYYEVIGISANATKDQIRKAYYKKLKMYHPDVFQGDEEVCKKITEELNQAYQVLRDEEQRKVLDREFGDYKYTESTSDSKEDKRHIFKDFFDKIKSLCKSKSLNEQNTCSDDKFECVIETKKPKDLVLLNYFIYGFCALFIILIIVFFIV